MCVVYRHICRKKNSHAHKIENIPNIFMIFLFQKSIAYKQLNLYIYKNTKNVKESCVANIQIVTAIISHEREPCSTEKCILPSLGQEMSKKSPVDLGPTTKKLSKVTGAVTF